MASGSALNSCDVAAPAAREETPVLNPVQIALLEETWKTMEAKLGLLGAGVQLFQKYWLQIPIHGFVFTFIFVAASSPSAHLLRSCSSSSLMSLWRSCKRIHSSAAMLCR